MADLLRLGVVLDPTQTTSGASAIKREFDGVGQSADKMQSTVSGAAGKMGQTLSGAGRAGTQAGSLIAQGASAAARGLQGIDPAAERARTSILGLANAGGLLQTTLGVAFGSLLAKLVELGVQMAVVFPKDILYSALQFDDSMKQATVAVAGLLERTRPEIVKNWSDALRVSGEAMTELFKKSQQVNVPLEDLAQIFRYVAAGSGAANKSIEDQINLTAKLGAAVQILDPYAPSQQKARDINDIIQGNKQGATTVIGRQIVGSQASPEVQKAYKDATTAAERFDAVQQGANDAAIAAGHSNEILSVSFVNLKKSIEANLGQDVLGLYQDLDTAVNNLRTALTGQDLGAPFKPLVDYLRQAVQFASELATAIAQNPEKNLGMIMGDAMSVASAKFIVELDQGINDVFSPTFGNALLNSLSVFGETLIDLSLRFGSSIQASMATVLQKSGFQEALERIGYDIGAEIYGGQKAPNPGDKDFTAKGIDDFYHKQGIGTADDPYAKSRSATDIYNSQVSNNQAAISSWDAMVKSRTGIVGFGQSDPNNAQQTLTDAMNKLDADLKVAASNKYELVGPPKPLSSDLTSTPNNPDGFNKEAALKTLNEQIEADKIKAQEAEATFNQKAITDAQNLVKVEEYKKTLIESGVSDMDQINTKAAAYAVLLAQHTGQLQAQKLLLDQINLAEEQATAARGRVSQIQQNPFQSQESKRPQLSAAYDAEIAALQKAIALNQQAINSGALKDPNAIATRQKDIDKNNQEIIQAKTQKSLQTDGGVFYEDMTKYFDSLGNAGSRVANVITGTLNTAISSTTDNVMKLIDGTQTLGQTFQKIGLDIVNALEQAIIKMALMQGMQAALGGLGVGGGGAGILGSLFSSGYHAGGVVGLESSFARSLPKFHNGGVSDDEQLAVLKKGESVLTPAQMRAVGGGEEQTDKSGSPIHLHVVNVNDSQSAMRLISNTPGFLLNEIGKQPSQFRAVLGR